jgi:trk system potassium uptake protein TrkA
MNVLIAGAGRLGEQAAHLLAATGHRVTVIERDRTRLTELASEHRHQLVHGDACEPTVLERAGVRNADLLLAATGENEDNLVIALLAKRQFGVARTLARVNDPDDAWLFDDRWGVDAALPSAAPLVSLIEEAAGVADTFGLLRLTTAGVTLIESRLTEHSSAVGRSLTDIGLPQNTIVAAVVRHGRPVVPGPDHCFASGDTLLVVTTTATENDIHNAFQ